MSTWLAAHGLPYRDAAEKAYSTDANIWGATHEAKTLEHLDVSLETVEPIMGVKYWDPAVRDRDRGRHDHLRGRVPGRRSTACGSPTTSRSCSRPTGSADATASACRTRSRTGSSRPSRAASTRRPGMALLFIAYERLVNAIHNEDTVANYHDEGRKLGRLLYEGRWLDPQALMVRESIQRWIASLVTGHGHAPAAPRRRLHDPRHPGLRLLLPPGASSRWSGSRTPPSGRRTGSASSPCATSTSPTPGPSWSSTPGSRWSRGRCSSSTARSSASCPRAASTGSRRTGAERRGATDDPAGRRLDDVALEAGTD